MVYNKELGRIITMAAKKEKEARQKKIDYNAKRNEEVSVLLSLRFQKATDMDVIEKIKSQHNKVGYIRELVRADIAKSNKE